MANNGGYNPNTTQAALPPSPSDAAFDSVDFTLDSGNEEQFGQAPYDAAESQDVMGNPSPDDTELWGDEAAAFIASAPGGKYGPTWVGKRPLGQGGFGRAGLWERYDDEGNMQEQMVIKENMREREAGEWDSHVPAEVYIMQRLNLAECPTIVRLLDYKRFPTAQTHRLYLEYCPHGDLRKLYKRYKAWRRYLPEAFLWHVFHDLVESAMAMYCGPGYNAFFQAWAGHEVVHRDIKPGNIFLGNERPPRRNSDVASYYPTAKMGDFGLAIVTGPGDIDNPRKYRRAGTPGYRAPEQEARHRPNHQPPWMAGRNDQILWWTNVWAIGVVMYELTTLHRAARVLYNRPDAEGRGCPAIWTNKQPDYSAQLCDTIRDCLNVDPSERLTLVELRQLTRRFARLTKDQLVGQRTAPDVPCEEERVYYRHNEINDMAPGGDYIPSRVHGQMMHESGFWNPDVSVLRYPNFTPFEDSDEAGEAQDEAEMAEAEGVEGEMEEGEVLESRTMRAKVQPTVHEDEDGMDVDEPTVVPGGDGQTVRANVERPAPDARLGGMNAFGRPRMRY